MSKKIIFALLLISIVILSIFCFSEIMIRLFGYQGEPSLMMSYAYEVDDPVINYRFKPHSIYSKGRVKYHFNSNGLRDYDIPIKKEANVFRIVMLGDSLAEGYGVHLEDTVGKQIEFLLNKRTNKGKVEVINIAMAGLNTFQEAHLFEILGVKYKPDLIIIAHVLNDADNGVFFKQEKREERYTKINLFNISVPIWVKATLKKSALLFFINNRIDALIWKFDVNDSDDNINSIKTDYFHKIYKDYKKFHQVLEGFEKISRKAKELQCDVIMAIFPIMYDFENYDWMDIHTMVRGVGHNYGFSVIDIFNTYTEYSVKSLRLERGDFVHPNKNGHRIAAEAICNYIEENTFLEK